MLPEIFESVPDEADDDEPNRSCCSHRGDEYEDRSDAALGDDHLRTAVRHREADIDRGDERQSQRIDGRRVEPPERKWRSCHDYADHGTPDDRCGNPARLGGCARQLLTT